VTPAEFIAARKLLAHSDAELAASLGVKVGALGDWAAGRKRIPPRLASSIVDLADDVRHDMALRESGLPECVWISTEYRARIMSVDLGSHAEVMKAGRELEEHRKDCPTCSAREEFVLARFGRSSPPRDARTIIDRVFDLGQSAWSVVVWLFFFIIAADNGMLGEPTTWVILALPIVLFVWGWRRRRRA
jgi:DNA-binding transcriptional regulator YdaS (Cro superfamily)